MWVYIILLVIVLFGATPFETIQLFINGTITSVNVVLAGLWAVSNSIIQFLLGVIYGLMNVVMGTLYNTLSGLLGAGLVLGEWDIIEAPSIIINYYLPYVNFSAFLDTAVSPIGYFLNFIFQDAFISNVVGGIALAVLAILIIIVAVKVKVPKRKG